MSGSPEVVKNGSHPRESVDLTIPPPFNSASVTFLKTFLISKVILFSLGWLANVRTFTPKVGTPTAYIGRPGKWGNPFPVSEHGRMVAIEKYEAYLLTSGLLQDINELKGHVLLCHCDPLPCHGQVLLKYLE